MRHWSGHNRWCPGKIWFSRSKQGRRTIFLTCGKHFWFPFFIILKTILEIFFNKKRKTELFFSTLMAVVELQLKQFTVLHGFAEIYYYFATSTYKFNCLFNNASFKADFQVASSLSGFYFKAVLKSSTSFTSDPLKLHFSFGMRLFI